MSIHNSAIDALRIAEQAVEHLCADLSGLLEPPPDPISGSAAARRDVDTYLALRAMAQRLEAAALTVLPDIERDGLWALDGARSFPVWLAHRERISTTTARRQAHLARTLRDDLPRTSRAMAEGQVSVEHARVLATVAATSEQRRAVLADPEHPCNEDFLLTQARMQTVDGFRRLTRRWAAAADPEADERGYRDAAEREFFDVARTLDGYHLAGFLTAERGQVLATALRAVTGVPAADDTRTAGQRRATALGDLARLALDHGLVGTGNVVRPHLNVHVSFETLAGLDAAATSRAPEGGLLTGAGLAAVADGATPTGTAARSDRAAPPAELGQSGTSPIALAELDDGTPLPRSLLERISCDSSVTRIVFGPDAQPLDVGRSQRTFPGPQRKAVIARDRHCVYPGCHAPPALSEIHHIVHWAHGGPTSAENGILLCWHHHDWIHRREISIRRSGAKWQFIQRDGVLVESG